MALVELVQERSAMIFICPHAKYKIFLVFFTLAVIKKFMDD